MLFRLMYEGAVGVITLAAISIFGEKGFAAFALLALLPVIWRVVKIKPDERELQLFYQTNSWALFVTILAMFAIYKHPEIIIGGMAVGDMWFLFSVLAMLVGRGLVGLLIFRLR